MANSDETPKMRYNPFWYQGWDFVGEGGLFEITEDLDMKGFGIKNLKDPSNPQDAVTKKYVDDVIAGGGGGGGGPLNATQVSLTPTGNIQSTNVQSAFEEMAQEAAIKDERNTFTQPQTIGGAEISEIVSAAPYANRPYASQTGKITNISSQNPINFETTEITLNGSPIPAKDISYKAKAGGQIQGVTVQDAIVSADGLISNVQKNYVAKTGLTADLPAGTYKITDLGDGVSDGDAVNMGQLKTKADVSTVTSLQNQVTQNTNNITNITSGATKIDSANVIFAPATGGVLTGKTNVQEALELTDSLIKGNQTSITDLQTQSATFLTKVGGVLGGDLDANNKKITKLATPTGATDAVNKDFVDKAIGAIQGTLSGQLQWAGTYDCTDSQIKTLSDAGKALQSGGNPVFVVGQNLPQPSQTTKNYYFIVINKTEATPSAPAPQEALSAGDWIIGETADWSAIKMAKAITATNVSFSPTSSISSQTVQQAIEEVDGDVTALTTKVDEIIDGTNKLGADKVSYTEKPQGVVKGTTVQEALTSVDGTLTSLQSKSQQNETDIGNIQTTLNNVARLDRANVFAELNTFTQVPKTNGTPTQTNDLATVGTINQAISRLTASQVTFDPSISQNPQLQGVVNTQQAIDKISNADNVKFDSTSQMSQTTVSTAIDHLNSEIGRLSGTIVKSQDVQMTSQLTNLPGANVQEVLAKADQEVGRISDHLVNNSALVGTYDITQNQVIEAFGLGAVGQTPALTVGQEIPAASDQNKTFVLIVKVGGTVIASSQPNDQKLPAGDYKSGDLIRSDGANWHKIDASEMKYASEIGIQPIQGVTGANVQEALLSLATKQTAPITGDQVSVNIQNPLTGNNVQEALDSARNLIQANKQGVQEAKDLIQNISASNVSYDNTTSQIQGNPATVQKVIEAINSKITTSISSINATNVSFTSQQGITGDNVALALDELKQNEANFITKIGGVLGGDLNANNKKITDLATPTNNSDVANKQYVDTKNNDLKTELATIYVKRSGGQLDTNLNANNKKITDLADPTDDKDAVNKKFVGSEITNLANVYVKRSGGQLDTNLNANSKKITGLANPTDGKDAVNKNFVDNEITNLANVYVKKDGGELSSDLDAMNNKIIDLAAGTNQGDAINKKQLDDAIQGVQGQLTGKLTYCGTYNASTNQVASVSTTGSTHGFTVGNPLPNDSSNIANCFLIVSVAGTGTPPAPIKPLGVGDIVLAQGGSGWLDVPIGSTRTASNVSVTTIQQLPNVTNVQEALEQLATKSSGNINASNVTFSPVGGIAATNVQEAIAEVDSETVKLDGNQTISGVKTFNNSVSLTNTDDALRLMGGLGQTTRSISWMEGGNYIARVGTRATPPSGGDVHDFNFEMGPNAQEQIQRIRFNRRLSFYDTTLTPEDDRDLTTKKYVDDAISSSGEAFVKKTGGQLTGSLDANSQNITGLADPTDATDAVNKQYMEASCVLTTGRQRIEGRKTIVSGFDFKSSNGVAYNINIGTPANIQWWDDAGSKRYAILGFTSPSNPTLFKFDNVATKQGSPDPKFQFNQIVEYANNSIQPTEPRHLTTKKYVDDAIAAGGGGGSGGNLTVLSASHVDITTSFSGLTGVGTATFSYKLLKDNTDGSILSANFGMKLTLTAQWQTTPSNTPAELASGAHIPRQDYYLGLPVPIDNSLGGSYKTVAHLRLYRAVPTGGIPFIQQDAPITLGRIVCLNDNTGSGWTKLYAVVSQAIQIQPPVGQGSFYIVRYEGLQSMPF